MSTPLCHFRWPGRQRDDENHKTPSPHPSSPIHFSAISHRASHHRSLFHATRTTIAANVTNRGFRERPRLVRLCHFPSGTPLPYIVQHQNNTIPLRPVIYLVPFKLLRSLSPPTLAATGSSLVPHSDFYVHHERPTVLAVPLRTLTVLSSRAISICVTTGSTARQSATGAASFVEGRQ